MPDRPRAQTAMEFLVGTRDALRYLLSEVEAVGIDDLAGALEKALEAAEEAIRRRLS